MPGRRARGGAGQCRVALVRGHSHPGSMKCCERLFGDSDQNPQPSGGNHSCFPRGEAMPPLCPRCPLAVVALAVSLPAQRRSLLTPAGVRASRGGWIASRPGSVLEPCPGSAVGPGYCSVGSTASGPVMRAANVLSPCFAMKGPSTPGAQRSKASPNLSLFKPARLFLDVYRVLCGAGRADRGLATLCLGGFRSPGGPAACREWPGPVPRAAGAFPGLIFHH